MRLTVTHISGIGEDSIFVGSIEALPRERGTARLWVMPQGQISCVDADFVDWTGFTPLDLVDANLTKVMMQAKALEQMMAEVAEANMDHGVVKVDLGHGPVLTIPYSVSDGVVHIARRKFSHKYSSSPVLVDMRVRKLVIGSHLLYELTLSRAHDKNLSGPPMMLVSDRNGCIKHLTSNLASHLNSTPKDIMTDGATRTIDALIPEPYRTLHLTLMKNAAPRGDHNPAPAYSCLKGAVLCLQTIPKNSVEPSLPVPVKMTVTHRELGHGEPGYVVQMETLTLSQALDHKRLKVTVDSWGVVQSVHGASPRTLFGFNPKLLVGNTVNLFLDVFKSTTETLEDALSVLAECTDQYPGISWRVGVISPVQVDPDLALSGRMEQIKKGGEVMTGILMVKRKLPGAGGAVHVGAGEKASSRWVWARDLSSAIAPKPTGDEASKQNSVLYELEIWRSDLLVSVIDLNIKGELEQFFISAASFLPDSLIFPSI